MTETIDPDQISTQPQADSGWNSYQERIFQRVGSGNEPLSIEAVAGSGKTTTLLEVSQRIPQERPLFLAFNKHIAEEMSQRGANARTLHSLGLAALRDHWGGWAPQVDPKKVWKWVNDNIDHGALKGPTAQLIKNARNEGMGVLEPVDEERLREVRANYAIQPPPRHTIGSIVEGAKQGCRALLEDFERVDFDDMLLMPLMLGAFERQGTVMVDECQDLAAVKHEIVARVADRPILAGDEHQSIYGFLGSLPGSMGRLGRRFGTQACPLSVTYRCPQAVVGLAQSIQPEIEAAPGAIEGEVGEIERLPLDELGAGDLVLCRTNAPLYRLAVRMVQKGAPGHILGKEFSKTLTSLVRSLKGKDLEDLVKKVQEWSLERQDRAETMGEAEAIRDRAQSVLAVAQEVDTIEELIERIEWLTKEGNGARLATVHKAKGTEANRVWIVRPELMPAPFAEKEWELEQERNIQYVAWTRAKEALYFVGGKG